MNRIVLGAVAALLLVGAGLFWWQGRAATEQGAPLPDLPMAPTAAEEELPFADASGLRGPAPPEVNEVTKEQRRFDRVDHDRDGRITANEMLAPRVAAFRKLDVDGNNLLTFQEWSVRTSDRFKAGDANRDNALTRAEFVTTKPKAARQPECRCAPRARPAARAALARPALPEPEPEDSAEDEGEPVP